MNKKVIVTIVFLLTSLSGFAGALPEGEKVKPEVAAEVRRAVEEYMKREEGLKGGFFLRDSKTSQVRDLRFDYVHSGVDLTSEKRYQVCVDFLDQSKNRLDVDFYLESTKAGDFQVTKIKVHRINGVEQKEE